MKLVFNSPDRKTPNDKEMDVIRESTKLSA
jgi:hypothetical protein